ncbi:hypothetical protein L6164_017098 [Bauhinia variegata]|uniref:Uncharacterized protein n=1 Tax=Bauhinia variegata TaxID=167791 RepID=A0ACB9N6Z5_BAUVA|nr:hypothetical protein L6164_017098 [Bauhinia variegata]
MEHNGCLPNPITYEIIICALLEKNENDNAKKLVQEMVAREKRTSMMLYHSSIAHGWSHYHHPCANLSSIHGDPATELGYGGCKLSPLPQCPNFR